MSQIAPDRTLTEEVAEFLARRPSADELVNFHVSHQPQERVRALMEKNKDGIVTVKEAAELDETTVLDQLFTLIRARLMPPSSHTDAPAGRNA